MGEVCKASKGIYSGFNFLVFVDADNEGGPIFAVTDLPEGQCKTTGWTEATAAIRELTTVTQAAKIKVADPKT
jgi:hypothetical protein